MFLTHRQIASRSTTVPKQQQHNCDQSALAEASDLFRSVTGIPVSARPKSGYIPEQSNSTSATVISAGVPSDNFSADVSKLMVTDPS